MDIEKKKNHGRAILIAERKIGRVPPEEIRHLLPWGGITPVGQEILREAERAWAARR